MGSSAKLQMIAWDDYKAMYQLIEHGSFGRVGEDDWYDAFCCEIPDTMYEWLGDYDYGACLVASET